MKAVFNIKINFVLMRTILTPFLVFSLAFGATPFHTSRAAMTIDEDPWVSEEEVKTSIDVGRQYLEMLDKYEAILDGKPVSRLANDKWSLLQQRAFPNENGKTRVIPWWDVVVKIMDFETEKEVSLTDMKNNGNFKKGSQPSSYVCPTGKTCRFNFEHPKFEGTLNEFRVPFQQVVTFGQYLVMIRDESFDVKNKRQVISYIDLDTHSGLIGNESLPIYEVAINTEAPIKTLEVADGVLRVDGNKSYIHPVQLAQISSLMTISYNIKANLVNPATFAKSMSLYENLVHVLNRYMEVNEDLAFKEKETAQRVVFDMDKLKTDMLEDVELQKKREELRVELDGKLQAGPLHGREVLVNAGKIVQKENAKEHIGSEQQEMVDKFVNRLEENRVVDSAILGVQATKRANETAWRELMTVIKKLSSPRPGASNHIKNALAAIFAKVKMDAALSYADFYKDDNLNLKSGAQLVSAQIKYKSAKLVEWFAGRPMVTAGMMASVIAGVSFPEAYTLVLNSGVNLVGGIADYITGLLIGTKSAVVEGATPVASSLDVWSENNPIKEAYFSADNIGRFGIMLAGFTAIAGAILGSIHFLQAMYSLYAERVSDRWQGFVEYMERMEQAYLDELAESEGKRLARVAERDKAYLEKLGGSAEEVEQRAKKLVEEVKLRNKQAMENSKLYKWSLPVRLAFAGIKKSLALLGTVKKVLPDLSKTQVGRYLHAARVFIFSFAAYTKTALLYSFIWNGYSLFRYSMFSFARVKVGKHRIAWGVKFKPTGAYIRMVTPKFVYRVVATKIGKITLPTQLNGGLEYISEMIKRFSIRQLNMAFLGAKHEDVEAKKKSRRTFEDQISEIESKVVAKVTKASLNALVDYVKDPEQLEYVFESDGINDITAKGLQQLNRKNQTFLRTYFDSTFDAAMKVAVAEMFEQVDSEALKDSIAREAFEMVSYPKFQGPLKRALNEAKATGEMKDLSLLEMKELIITYENAQRNIVGPQVPISFRLSDRRVLEIVNETIAQPEHFGIAAHQANEGKASGQNWVRNIKYDYTTYLDPSQNASLQRYAVVQERRKDAQAMGRAVRQETIEMFTTLPIDLGMKLALTAGITQGPYVPLQKELWSDSSILYGSRMSLYGGLASGLALGQFANAWYKIQEDQLNEAAGGYGKVPQGEDAKMSMLSWYLKQWNADGNGIMDHYKRSLSIAVPNIPAALPNIALLNLNPFFGLGRLDLTHITIGYVYMLLPISPFFTKFEQTFERSAHYVLKDFPRDLWDHPVVQEYMGTETAKARVKFNLLRDILFNPVGEAIGNVMVTGTETHGTRGLARAVLPGDQLPDEAVINGTRELAEKTKEIPVISSFTEGLRTTCEKLLNGDYKEWTNVK